MAESAERAEVRDSWDSDAAKRECEQLHHALADAQREVERLRGVVAQADMATCQTLYERDHWQERAATLEGALREETERCIGIVQRYLGTQNRLLAQKERDIVEAMRLPDAMGERALTRPAPRAEGQ